MKLTGTPIPGYRLSKDGSLKKIPKDASAARRQRPDRSKKVRVRRKRSGG